MKVSCVLKKMKSIAPVFHQSYQTETSLILDSEMNKGYSMRRQGAFTLDLRKVALCGAAFAALVCCVHIRKR